MCSSDLRDLAELQAAKREHTGDPEAEFHAWDNSFYRNRLMLSKYAVDNEAVREYFPIERVTERSEEHTSELQSRRNFVCRLLLEKNNNFIFLYLSHCSFLSE